ncbi:hypothetical protein [Paraburkholderia mimosarum]|uniref:hypothetical protein n=1 Tax=Paraburkholderia mimosarum TaxID=312026 RepID=UPI000483F66C|nr:hypothetical protein [Paraburkholderia mimosarum]
MEERPLLGIIQLDCDDATSDSSVDIAARGAAMPFWVGDPSFWKMPFQNRVAEGADPAANKIPTPEAVRGIGKAAGELDGKVQLIIGNCGYMWASRESLYGNTATATITSALEFVDLALKITNRPIGIITWDANALMPLLRDYPGRERLRFLTVGDLPEWEKSLTYQKAVGWSKDQMAKEFAERLGRSFNDNGVFEDVGILVLECTLVPDFRHVIRQMTALPILDLLTFARTALQ